MAAQYRGDPVAVVAYFGDGATSKGDFHEGFNMAGVFRLPVVFICQNNQWAISVPRTRQTAAATLAQKAYAYGFEGIQVDGNDVFAVYSATRRALERARSGGGPTFIECFTYRISHHTTADDADRYRDPVEVTEWKKRDPLERLRLFLEKRGYWSKDYQSDLEKRTRETLDQAVRAAESADPPKSEEIFRTVFESCTPRQLRELEVMADADV
jgi:pyruvate dehydrogenase E1 component alpha subunit